MVRLKHERLIRPILLVEDSPIDLDLTLRAFARHKFADQIQVALDGEEALAWIERWDGGEPWPAVILLDLKLPKIDGLEVLRQLKAHPEYCAIPVVVLTTSSENSDIKTAYKIGANSYLFKPVDYEKFTEVTAQIRLYWGVLNEPPV